MSKLAFIFPGQGAQYIGMGQDFYEHTETGKKIINRASELLGFSMPDLCFKENDQLNLTEYTQAAMVTVSIAMMKVLEEKGIKPDVAAGLSLGEYAALTAVGAIKDEDAIAVVRQRGILMQEAVPAGIGSMAAVLGMDNSLIEEVVRKIDDVWIANYNCPGQTVISGKKEAVDFACEQLKEAGAKRTLLLKVSGPFHSGMLKEAGEKLGKVLENVHISDPVIPYVANVTAEYVREGSKIKDLLKNQVSSSVRWQQSMEAMLLDGVDTFIEIGPGKTLTGFMKKIDRRARVLSIEKLEDVEKAAEVLSGDIGK